MVWAGRRGCKKDLSGFAKNNCLCTQFGFGSHHKFFNYVVLQLWMYCIRFVTPVALGIAIINSLVQEFVEPYEGYPISGILFLGVGWILVTHVVAFGFSGLPWGAKAEPS